MEIIIFFHLEEERKTKIKLGFVYINIVRATDIFHIQNENYFKMDKFPQNLYHRFHYILKVTLF